MYPISLEKHFNQLKTIKPAPKRKRINTVSYSKFSVTFYASCSFKRIASEFRTRECDI